ncbi:MAG: hypothetical protein KGH60_03105 [Candidatus Micrarchaeota archaeon]|nr:hypothetical protein [Candidatus Micrarchaeota archaeon]
MATIRAAGQNKEDDSNVYAKGSMFYGKTLQDAIKVFKDAINEEHNKPSARVKIRARIMKDPQSRPRTVAATITEINEGRNLIFYTAHDISITRNEETGIYACVQDSIRANVITPATTPKELNTVGIYGGLATRLLAMAAVKLGKTSTL